MDTLKYEITDRANSLNKYNFFLKNMGVEKTLQQLIKEILIEKERAKISDIGCGEAGALKELKKEFGEKITVCGNDLLKAEGLDDFFCGSAVEIAFPKNCDLIISFRALHEIANLETIFEKISESLTSGGQAFLSIRCQQAVSGKTFFHGNLEKEDLVFLQKIKEKKEFKKLKGLVIEIEQITPQKKTIIAGVNVLLYKI